MCAEPCDRGREGGREKDGEGGKEGPRGMVKGLNLSVCVLRERDCVHAFLDFICEFV